MSDIEQVTTSHGWAVGQGCNSDQSQGVLLYVLEGPICMTPSEAEAMATALLLAAKNCRSGADE